MTKTTLQAWHALTEDHPLDAIHVSDGLGVGVSTIVEINGKQVAAVAFAPSCEASVLLNEDARQTTEATEESE